MSSQYIVTPNLEANGNILPSVFVKQDLTQDFSVIQSTANARTFAISQPGVKYPPGTPGDQGYAFIQGDACTLYGPGSVCLLAIGSGGVTRGDLLESDANGAGVTSTTSGHNVGAVALESGNYGEFRKVFVVFTTHP